MGASYQQALLDCCNVAQLVSHRQVGSDIIDTDQPSYRIVGKVIDHAPYHGIIRESGYPSDELPE
ncbi:MAG: hypothetical protein EBT09_03225 [Actinobacteria bacterium]|nr:hypothetical protein [Actinomycetota bacterium]